MISRRGRICERLWSKERAAEQIAVVSFAHAGRAARRIFFAPGDQAGDSGGGHHCHMYRWAEFEALLKRHSCTIVAASAANFLSVNHDDGLREIETDAAPWELFLQ